MPDRAEALRGGSGTNRPGGRLRGIRLAVGVALWGCVAAGVASGAGLPPEDECPLIGGTPGSGPNRDAVPTRLSEGMTLSFSDLLQLRTLLPEQVWRNRDQFFHEGMRMLIGPCHRRYPVPAFFTRASEEFAGRPRRQADPGRRVPLPSVRVCRNHLQVSVRHRGQRWPQILWRAGP